VIIEEIFQFPRGGKKIKRAGSELAFTGYIPTFIEELLVVDGLTMESIF
jgi:hypothetical protein